MTPLELLLVVAALGLLGAAAVDCWLTSRRMAAELRRQDAEASERDVWQG